MGGGRSQAEMGEHDFCATVWTLIFWSPQNTTSNGVLAKLRLLVHGSKFAIDRQQMEHAYGVRRL